jgi:hypothetical protein
MKHLNLDKQSNNLQVTELIRLVPDVGNDSKQDFQQISMALPERKKRFGEQVIVDANLAPLSFDEKRKLREKMFDYFEDSTIEETRLVIIIFCHLLILLIYFL